MHGATHDVGVLVGEKAPQALFLGTLTEVLSAAAACAQRAHSLAVLRDAEGAE